MKCQWSVQCVHNSLYQWRVNVRGKVRLSGRMKNSVGHGRCEGSGEKGAHELAMMRSWMTRGRREVVLDAVMVLGVFEVMRRSVESGLKSRRR